ncbi:hypothetical protein QVD17_37370 [Tagetes erecta]|uniref:Wall-associated receptor kinase galacturonan-binding domain-containing protein n=1 Tax=Tagetes erecta TaxID=13708 RepID=A0AAD8JU45_TARER|nr:hypothetical protein QVD17_37370 [Tagetes erecta]
MKLSLANYLHLLLLLCVSTSLATPKYAKTGCSDKCGNVRIPYPFGIGARCSVNHWYNIDCSSSTPYLPAFNNLKVLGVDLRNQTVTVSTTRIPDCKKPVWNSNEIMGVDLGRSPFLFSKSHNTFVFEGCGTAAIMANGSVVTGCSTACPNVSRSDIKNCYGVRCCQTEIPRYLKSYNINITRSGEDDGACGSAFWVDKTSYEEGRFSDPLTITNASGIPISLLWTLSESDQITCCDDRTRILRRFDVFNSTPVDTWKCNYNTKSSELNPYLIDGCTVTPKYAKTGCNDKCGNVTIPYPFGIGADCSVNQWYTVDCNFSTPYLPALNHLKVLDVSLDNQIVTISTKRPRVSNCQKRVWNSSEIMGVDLDGSPFLFSKSHNKFVFEGCGTATMINNGSVLTGCSTACHSLTPSDRNNCFGNACCQTSFDYYFKSFNINLTNLKEEDGACGSAFLVDETSYEEGTFSDPFSSTNTSSVPISLTWTLSDSDKVTCCIEDERLVLRMFTGTPVYTWKCSMHSFSEGNPYLKDGCKDGAVGSEDPTDECRRCKDSGGNCRREKMYDIDGFLFSDDFSCYHESRTSLGVILGRNNHVTGS